MKQDRNGVRTAQDLERKYDLSSIGTLKKNYELQKTSLNKVENELNNFVVATTQNLEELQNQVDGNITTWFSSGVPTLNNYPANEWTDNDTKNNHLGDLYYDRETGYAYRFTLDNNTYQWIDIKDTDVTQALALANAAQDTADSKRRVFVVQPTPPYDVGDLWLKDEELYRCQITKGENESYAERDWIKATKYTDDTVAYQVDGKLTILSGTVTEIRDDVDELSTTMTNTTTLVNEQGQTIGTLQQQQSSTSQTVNQISSTVSSISNRVDTQGNTIFGLSTQIGENTSDITTLKSNVTTLQQTDSEISARVTTNETKLENLESDTTPTSTSSGSSISLNDSADAELIDFELEGKTEQETRSGKNLFNRQTKSDGKVLIWRSGAENAEEGSVTSDYFTKDNLTSLYSNYKFIAFYYDSNKTYLGNGPDLVTAASTASLSTTIPDNSNIAYIRVEWRTGNNSSADMTEKTDIMLTKTEAELTPYEEYGTMPSPDYPSELVSVGYENLFDYTTSAFSNNNVEIIAENNTLTMTTKVTTTSNNLYFRTKIPDELLKNGETYTMSSVNVSGVAQPLLLQLRNKDGSNAGFGTFSSVVYDDNYSLYIVGNIFATSGSTEIPIGTTAVIKNIQVVKSNQANSYIPYGKYGVEIKNVNKNLFTGLIKGIGLNSTTGAETVNANAGTSEFIEVDFNTNQNYYLSGLTNTIRFYVAVYNSNKQFLGRTGGTRGSSLLLSSDIFISGTPQGSGDIAYLRVTQYAGSGDTGTIDDVDNLQIQLEEGTQATTYEPHVSHTNLIVLDQPLRSIGNTKDLLYIKNGMLYVERKIGSVVFDGTESGWAISNTGTSNFFYRYRYLENVGNRNQNYYFSNHFVYAGVGNTDTNEGMFITSSNELRLRFGTEMTLADFKTWLSTHNTEVQYILAEPYTEEVGQVDIPSTYKGVTHIDTTDELKPNMSITYVRDTALGNYVEEQFNSVKTIEERHYAELKISDSEIIANVNATLTNYSTTTEMNAAITLKANEINQVVSTKVGNDEVISKINQSSESITINANKLNLQGYITATDLSTSGSTIINGSNITTGTIDASTVSVTNINANNITGGTINGTNVTITNLNASNITSGTLSANNVSGGTLSSSSISVGGSSYYLKMGTSWTKHPEVSGLNVTGGGGININNLGFNSDGSKFTFAGGVQSAYFTVTNGLTINSGATLTCYGNIATNQIKPGGYLQIATGGRTGYGTNSGSIYLYASAHITLSAAYDHYVYIGNANVGNTRAAVDGSGPSSRCLKTNISEFTKSEYTEALQLLNDIKLYDYKYKYNIHPKENQYGFIIDDLLDNKLADKFLYFRDEKAGINENNYLDYSVVEDNPNELPLINFKRYDEETLIKYLLVVCKALQYKIDKLESEV